MFNPSNKMALKLFDSQGFINEHDISEQGGLMKFLNGGKRINKLFGSPTSSNTTDENELDSSNDIILVEKIDDQEIPGPSQKQNEESHVEEKSLDDKSRKDNSLILPETQDSPQKTPTTKIQDVERKRSVMKSLGLKQLTPIVITDDFQKCAKEQIIRSSPSPSPEVQKIQRDNEKSPIRTNLDRSGGKEFKVPLARGSIKRHQHDIRKSLFKDLRQKDPGFACSTPRNGKDDNFKDFRMAFSPIRQTGNDKNGTTSAQNEIVQTQEPKTSPSTRGKNKISTPKQIRSLVDIEKDIEKCYENLAGKKTPDKKTPGKKSAVAEPPCNITTEDDMSMEIDVNPKSLKKTATKTPAPTNRSSYIPVNIVETPVISRPPDKDKTFTELKEKLNNVSEFDSSDEDMEAIEVPELQTTPKEFHTPKSHTTPRTPRTPRVSKTPHKSFVKKLEIDDKDSDKIKLKTPKKSEVVQKDSSDDSDSEKDVKNDKNVKNTPQKSSTVFDDSDSDSEVENGKENAQKIEKNAETKSTNNSHQITKSDSDSDQNEKVKTPVKNRPNKNKKKESQVKSSFRSRQIIDSDSDTGDDIPKEKSQKSKKNVDKKSQKKPATKNNLIDSDTDEENEKDKRVQEKNGIFDKLKESQAGPSKTSTKTGGDTTKTDEDVFKKPALPTKSSTQLKSCILSPNRSSRMINVSFDSSVDNSKVPSPVVRSLRNSIRSSTKLPDSNMTNNSFAIPKNSLSKRKSTKIGNKICLDYLELSKRNEEKSNIRSKVNESQPNMSKKRSLFHHDHEDSDNETGESNQQKKTNETAVEDNAVEEPKEKPKNSKSTRKGKNAADQADPVVPKITEKKSTQKTKSKKKSPLKNRTNRDTTDYSANTLLTSVSSKVKRSELEFLMKYGPAIPDNENNDSTNNNELGRGKRGLRLRKPYWLASGQEEVCLLYSDYGKQKIFDEYQMQTKKLKNAIKNKKKSRILDPIEESEVEMGDDNANENFDPLAIDKKKRNTENTDETEPQKKKRKTQRKVKEKKSKSTNHENPVGRSEATPESFFNEVDLSNDLTPADNILDIIEKTVTSGIRLKSIYSASFQKENCRSFQFDDISIDVVNEGVKCIKYKNLDNSGYLVFEHRAIKNEKKCRKYPLNMLVMRGVVGITINDNYMEYGPGSMVSLEKCRYSMKNISVKDRAIIFYTKGIAPSVPQGLKE